MQHEVSVVIKCPVEDVFQFAPVLDRILLVEMSVWLAFGVFETMVGWFGLRQRQAWALWAVVLADAASLAGWWRIAFEYLARGVRLGLDLPPVVFLYATVVLPIAGLLGWLGIRQQ